MGTPRIYVVQENSRADYSDAERYGEIVFMTMHEYKPLNASLRNEEICAQIEKRMEQFEMDDFLVLTGNPTMIGFVFHLAVMKVSRMSNRPELNILQWDKISGSYRPFTFKLK